MNAAIFEPTLRTFDDADAVADAAAAEIVAFVTGTSRPVLGLATGRTPLAVYARLRAAHEAGRIGFAAATTFNLDEYRGIDPDHPASFHRYMRRELFDHVDLPPGRCHLPDGAGDPDAAAMRYEAAIRAAGGIGLQLLGIGRNGHIGFNEPGSAFDSRTREVPLSASTLAANAPDFPQEETPPATAITMGIGTILDARRILLLVTGTSKAGALAATLSGMPDRDRPASALRLHPDVTILCDRAAARDIPA